MRVRLGVVAVIAAVCLLVGAGAGILAMRVFGEEECVATVATGGTTPLRDAPIFGPQSGGRPITNEVAGRMIDGVCVPK
jgi:hypothetical protein